MPIDTHCHLQLEPLYSKAGEVLEQFKGQGLKSLLVPSYDISSWRRQDSLVNDFSLPQALGIHPWCLEDESFEIYRDELNRAFGDYSSSWGDLLVAVGEFGLDRSRPQFKANFDKQKSLFETHLELANSYQLPVVLHIVKAHGAALELLRAEQPRFRGVVHSYTGPVELIGEYVKLGLALSYSGLLRTSQKARAALKETPEESILFETDAPYGASIKGDKYSSPTDLVLVLEEASKILGKSKEWCWSVHRENSCRVFGSGDKIDDTSTRQPS